MENIQNRVDSLTELSLRYNESDQCSTIRAIYGQDPHSLSAAIIRRGLFLENVSCIDRITSESSRIHAYIPNHVSVDRSQISRGGLLNEYLNCLIESPPMKSFLKLSFCQMYSFIFSHVDNCYFIDLKYLTSFINELRASIKTMSLDDRKVVKIHGIARGISFYENACGDASFLLAWSLVESAKYCFKHKFAPNDMSATEFLELIEREFMAPVALGYRITQRLLINLVNHLDKFICNHTEESSTGRHTFVIPYNVEHFYEANRAIFQSWFAKNRQKMARLSLQSGDPAECWRNSSLKLFLALNTKLNLSRAIDTDQSFFRTFMSLDSNSWHSNLSLISLSAKRLDDLFLLQGIRAIIKFNDAFPEYKPLNSMINNVQGFYQQTYESLQTSINLDDQSIIELLNSCIELDLFDQNEKYIARFHSKALQDLYGNYWKSRKKDFKHENCFAEVEQWLRTWSELDNPPETLSVASIMDIIVPTCLNIIAKSDDCQRGQLIKRTESLISQDMIVQSLFLPGCMNNSIKIYHILLSQLRDGQSISANLVHTHAKDLFWNHLLYRHLRDLDLVDELRGQDGILDVIQFRAAKYHSKRRNSELVEKLVTEISKKVSVSEIKFVSPLLLTRHDQYSHLLKVAKDIIAAHLNTNLESDLILKVLRHILRLSNSEELHELESLKTINKCGVNELDEQNPTGNTYARWQNLLDCSSLISRTRTLALLSARSNERLQLSPGDDALLNSTLELDLSLLELISQTDSTNRKSLAIGCATRILRQFTENLSRLKQNNIDRFTSSRFIVTTCNIWMMLKNNLISITLYRAELASESRSILTGLLKTMTRSCPNVFVYDVLVNQLDLKNDLFGLEDKSRVTANNECNEDNESFVSEYGARSAEEIVECQRKLDFWHDMFKQFLANDPEGNWRRILLETEMFLGQIRKISFLQGEHLGMLATKTPKRLYSFLDYLSKHCDIESGSIQSKQRLEDCRRRLKSICQQALEPIRVWLNCAERVGQPQTTAYDIWFCDTFGKLLLDLHCQIVALSREKILLNILEKQVESISESLATCLKKLADHNHEYRQKLFMEMVSPILSRLEPSVIPMPGYCDTLESALKPPVTIHKISQTINLIVSKTSPKKLKFTGSDGVSRSFLLKAHEDLRLDQMVMQLFASINNFFLSDCETRDKFSIRRYSVTPVSSRSGLIEWIEAPSLCSSYRAWLGGVNGKKVIGSLYRSTCGSLCEDKSQPHTRCEPPQNVQLYDIFYQLLWANTKSTKLSITQNRPSPGNIVRYRSEFNLCVFQNIIEQLENRLPNELISNQLWYKSENSYSYWLKTREFVRSCATMSIVGYIIGLGDRHPENILLDQSTGEVIHIDYNICFELGKTLSIPEQVPFRLTQNMIRAFGFAGLEGGFTHSCRIVLNTLKRYTPVILHLLDPANLNFMVGQANKTVDVKKQVDFCRQNHFQIQGQSSSALLTKSTKLADKMDLCSQELAEFDRREANDLLILDGFPSDEPTETMSRNEAKPVPAQVPPTFNVQHNIKTPTKIPPKTAIKIHDRIRDKLSGKDESVYHFKYRQDCVERRARNKFVNIDDESENSKPEEQAVDLILLNDAQTTEDQVYALIAEATSIRNKAGMFEGWMAWI